MSGIVPPNDLTNIDFKKGTRTPRPLPPPGHAYDGQASEDLSALYPAEVQETTITLGGTTVVADVTTLTIFPTLTASGSAWADDLVPLVFTFTTAANPDDTLAKVAEGIAANAVAQQTVVDLEDLSNFNRVKDFIEVTAVGVDIIVTTRDSGASFTYLLEVSPAGITETSVTTGGTSDPLRVGLIGLQTAVNAKGERQIGLLGGGAVLGLIMYSGKVRPRNIGDQFDAYERGPYVVYRYWGTGTAYAEKGCAVDSDVYRRHAVTVAGDVIGAVSDTNSADHTAVTGAKFLQTTPAAGTAPIFLPHP